MVEQLDGPVWVLRPTRSLTWKQARYVVAAMGTVCIAIGGFFYALGLPLVLPYSGIEVIALATAFYVVLRAGQQREVIRIENDDVVVERGRKKIEERIEFNRFWVRVELARSRRRFHPRRLLLAAQGREIELGQFLTEGERESLAKALINALKKNG